MLRTITAAGVLLFFAACGRSTSTAHASSASASASSQVEARVEKTSQTTTETRLTPDEWKAALAAVMKISKVRDKRDGTREYFAAFGDRKKTDMFAFGTRDEFSKIQVLAPGVWSQR